MRPKSLDLQLTQSRINHPEILKLMISAKILLPNRVSFTGMGV
jgi:hypothetical protein